MAEIEEIVWTFKSRQDLRDIFDFLANKTNDKKASEIVLKIIDKVEVLYNSPLNGQKEPKFAQLKREYRRLVLMHYKIVYHIRLKKVYINRIFDSRRNPKALKLK